MMNQRSEKSRFGAALHHPAREGAPTLYLHRHSGGGFSSQQNRNWAYGYRSIMINIWTCFISRGIDVYDSSIWHIWHNSIIYGQSKPLIIKSWSRPGRDSTLIFTRHGGLRSRFLRPLGGRHQPLGCAEEPRGRDGVQATAPRPTNPRNIQKPMIWWSLAGWLTWCKHIQYEHRCGHPMVFP